MEPEQGLQDLVGFVASWWMGVGDREEWCPVTIEVSVEVKMEGMKTEGMKTEGMEKACFVVCVDAD